MEKRNTDDLASVAKTILATILFLNQLFHLRFS